MRNPPTYAAAFRCIGSSCEDPCCGDWDIPLDKRTYRKYQDFPEDNLGSLVTHFISINAAGAPDAQYARINRGPLGHCPFWDPDKLCSIQKEYGPRLLSATCSVYPRSLSFVNKVLEGSLSLSCPEAARNVLLNPGFMEVEGELFSGTFRTDNHFHLANNKSDPTQKSFGSFYAVRALLIELIRDRSRPLWKRLLLVGSLCMLLEVIEPEGNDQAALRALEEFQQMINSRTVPLELENMHGDPIRRLEVVLRLSDARVRENTCGRRFRDSYWTFVEGIGSSDGLMSGSDVDRFLEAEEKYHRPFFERFPFILENYLLNYMFQNLFPFGRSGSADFTSRNMFDEFILMTTQFAWINVLLIGIAGRHKENFSEQHIVQVIQSFTREVEHYPPVLDSILELMRSFKMDSLPGMCAMLRS